MNLKAAYAVILGLVFQLAQVLPAAVITAPCPIPAEKCDCCSDAESCPCVDNHEAPLQPQPPPGEPAAAGVKIPAARWTPATSWQAPRLPQPASHHPGARPPAGTGTAFPGIRLSVAFCSFVI